MSEARLLSPSTPDSIMLVRKSVYVPKVMVLISANGVYILYLYTAILRDIYFISYTAKQYAEPVASDPSSCCNAA